MDKREIFDKMLAEGLIPLIRASSAEEAIAVAKAIKDGGASFLEITMTVPEESMSLRTQRSISG